MTQNKVLVPGPDHPITLVATGARVTVRLGGRVVPDTQRALTMHEGTHPPVHHIPLDDVAPAAAWFYPDPYESVAAIRGHVAFYPERVDAIEVHRAA